MCGEHSMSLHTFLGDGVWLPRQVLLPRRSPSSNIYDIPQSTTLSSLLGRLQAIRASVAGKLAIDKQES
jgi:hypothetical protein